MGKTEKPQAGAVEKPATDAQLGLIRELMNELNHAILPDKWEGKALNRIQASEVVHYLKEVKVRDQALRAQNVEEPRFDKIGFGLVYKLVWRACEKMPTAAKPEQSNFEDIVNAEYKSFKKCQAACRQFVQDGGLQ